MVPSDPSDRSLPGRHARSEPGIRDGVTYALHSPPPVLPGCGSILRCASALVPVEAYVSIRPFTLRQRSLALQRVPAAESMLPACIFDIMLEPHLARSALRSRPCPAFSARQGSITAHRPLPTYDPSIFRSLPRRRSPPGPLDPSGSMRSARLHPEKLAFAGCPICLRSPSPCNNELPLCDGSTLQLRLLPAWLAVLLASWNQGHHALASGGRQAKI